MNETIRYRMPPLVLPRVQQKSYQGVFGEFGDVVGACFRISRNHVSANLHRSAHDDDFADRPSRRRGLRYRQCEIRQRPQSQNADGLAQRLQAIAQEFHRRRSWRRTPSPSSGRCPC